MISRPIRVNTGTTSVMKNWAKRCTAGRRVSMIKLRAVSNAGIN
jgi:hypothetical protein